MKVFFSYLLLFSLAFRPLYNLGYVAYFELNIDYVIETYCINKEKPKLKCNGKCHLAKQLAFSSEAENTEKSFFLSTIYEAFIPVYFQDYSTSLSIKFYKMFTVNNWSYCKHYTSVYKHHHDRPPQVM